METYLSIIVDVRYYYICDVKVGAYMTIIFNLRGDYYSNTRVSVDIGFV